MYRMFRRIGRSTLCISILLMLSQYNCSISVDISKTQELKLDAQENATTVDFISQNEIETEIKNKNPWNSGSMTKTNCSKEQSYCLTCSGILNQRVSDDGKKTFLFMFHSHFGLFASYDDPKMELRHYSINMNNCLSKEIIELKGFILDITDYSTSDISSPTRFIKHNQSSHVILLAYKKASDGKNYIPHLLMLNLETNQVTSKFVLSEWSSPYPFEQIGIQSSFLEHRDQGILRIHKKQFPSGFLYIYYDFDKKKLSPTSFSKEKHLGFEHRTKDIGIYSQTSKTTVDYFAWSFFLNKMIKMFSMNHESTSVLHDFVISSNYIFALDKKNSTTKDSQILAIPLAAGKESTNIKMPNCTKLVHLSTKGFLLCIGDTSLHAYQIADKKKYSLPISKSFKFIARWNDKLYFIDTKDRTNIIIFEIKNEPELSNLKYQYSFFTLREQRIRSIDFLGLFSSSQLPYSPEPYSTSPYRNSLSSYITLVHKTSNQQKKFAIIDLLTSKLHSTDFNVLPDSSEAINGLFYKYRSSFAYDYTKDSKFFSTTFYDLKSKNRIFSNDQCLPINQSLIPFHENNYCVVRQDENTWKLYVFNHKSVNIEEQAIVNKSKNNLPNIEYTNKFFILIQKEGKFENGRTTVPTHLQFFKISE